MIKRFKNIPKSILAALGWLFKGRCPVSSPPFTIGRCMKRAEHSGSHITWRWLILLLALFLPGCGLYDDNGRWPDSEHPIPVYNQDGDISFFMESQIK